MAPIVLITSSDTCEGGHLPQRVAAWRQVFGDAYEARNPVTADAARPPAASHHPHPSDHHNADAITTGASQALLHHGHSSRYAHRDSSPTLAIAHSLGGLVNSSATTSSVAR